MKAEHRKNRHFENYEFKPYPYQVNTVPPELNGVASMTSYAFCDSSTRRQMAAVQQGQAIATLITDEPFIQTGTERKFAKASLAIRAPCNLRIIDVIPFYQRDMAYQGIHYNSLNYIVYESLDDGSINTIELPEYASYHPEFGFKYRLAAGISLSRKEELQKDQVIAEVPNVDDEGMLKIGRNAPIAFLSHPGVADDGFIMGEHARKEFPYYRIIHRDVSFGSSMFPLFVHGEGESAKLFPDIGERIPENGLLMVLRSFVDELAACEQSRYATMGYDPVSDEPVWAEADSDVGEGIVVGIEVYHDSESSNPGIPVGMEKQLMKYHVGKMKFYNELQRVVSTIRRNSRGVIKLGEEIQSILTDAIAYSHSEDGRQKVKLTYAQKPLDDWRIHFTIRYLAYPGKGNKFTDCHGGKGTIVNILPEDQMPITRDGQRAWFILDPHSTNNRLNPGRLHEHFRNAIRGPLTEELRAGAGWSEGDVFTLEDVEAYKRKKPKEFEDHIDKLMRYYDLMSPEHYEGVKQLNDTELLEHFAYILNHGIHVTVPIDSQREPVDGVEQLEREFYRGNDSVTMGDLEGKKITIKDACSVSEMYMIMLEKTGDDWSAVSSARTQVHGVLSQVSKADKYRYPSRNQPTRFTGETEVRLLTLYGGPRMVAELMDRNNNIITHTAICWRLVSDERPGAIETIVDRKKYPITGGSALKIFKGILLCGGYEIRYAPYVNPHPRPVHYNLIGA